MPAFRLARFRKFELEIEQARILKEILGEASDAEPLIRSPLSKPGDPLKLRGVPIVGQGGIGLDGAVVLSFVVWPTAAVEEAVAQAPTEPPTRQWSNADLERVFELKASGLSQSEIGKELGRPRTSVAYVLKRGGS